MPLDAATIWGKNVADRIKALRPPAGTPVTDAQLEAIWAAVKEEDTAQLGKSSVASGAFQIINPETSSPVPVTGIGGPVT